MARGSTLLLAALLLAAALPATLGLGPPVSAGDRAPRAGRGNRISSSAGWRLVRPLPARLEVRVPAEGIPSCAGERSALGGRPVRALGARRAAPLPGQRGA